MESRNETDNNKKESSGCKEQCSPSGNVKPTTIPKSSTISELDLEQLNHVKQLNHLLNIYNQDNSQDNKNTFTPLPAPTIKPAPITRNHSFHSTTPSHQQHHHKSSDRRPPELKHVFGSAIKNSLGHVHDHIIATLPTDVSLYYQKIHDTLKMELNPPSTSQSSTSDNQPVMNEMHEFIADDPSQHQSSDDTPTNPIPSSSSSTTDSTPTRNVPSKPSDYNPYAPPEPRGGVIPIRDFLNDPLNASISTLNRVTNMVRLPTNQIYNQGYNIISNLSNNQSNQSSSNNNQPIMNHRTPGMAERVDESRIHNNSVTLPPPVLPLIQCTQPIIRTLPLQQDDWNDMIKQSVTVLQLRQRVFKGGICDELRLKLWPMVLGLSSPNDNGDDESTLVCEEFDWSNHEALYEHYSKQWKSILPDQEKRFMLFRERKSLIERDVIRCDRTHAFYHGDSNDNLDKLKQILLTYMMYDFDTGYVQGMSDLASPLLFIAQGDVCKAFWFFVQVMKFTNHNFEMSQLTIKHQLEMLWKLIELTDPIFAQYLANNESVNCYFAFRWIVCQFKREFMKGNCDDYQEVLLLWESIWTCSAIKQHLIQLKHKHKQQQQSDHKQQQQQPCHSESSGDSGDGVNTNETDDQYDHHIANECNQRRLSDTELYVLCICLAIIRRERDLIMAHRYDATDILKHFNTLELASNVKQILSHASNIWSWLIFDDNVKLLYEHGEHCNKSNSQQLNSKPTSSNNNNNNNTTTNDTTEDFDLLTDLRLPLDRHIASGEDYFLFG